MLRKRAIFEGTVQYQICHENSYSNVVYHIFVIIFKEQFYVLMSRQQYYGKDLDTSTSGVAVAECSYSVCTFWLVIYKLMRIRIFI
jgi:hypothetical protein